MMVHFFGILQPLTGKRHKADEAPGKSAFFGPEKERAVSPGEVTEQAQEEDPAIERQRFLLQSFSPHF